jgi:phosphoribosylformylglycinamidine synthase
MIELKDNSQASGSSTTTTPSIFFDGMRAFKFPIAVAHGEGRAEFEEPSDLAKLKAAGLVAASYSCVLAMMPHPERMTSREANSWCPRIGGPQWGENGPWLRMCIGAWRE